jgi:FemAB-related protein (PEP-CTERM system-associated)
LWVNTLGLRAPRLDTFTLNRAVEKLKEWSCPLRQVGENMWVLAPVMLPVIGNGVLGRLNIKRTLMTIRRATRRLEMNRPIFWSSIPTVADYVGHLDEAAVVYYVTDDYHLWPGGDSENIKLADRRLTERADLIFPCSEALVTSHRSETGRTILLPHGVDFDHFSQQSDEPQQLRDIPHPRACFSGLIYEKIDQQSLYTLVTQMPELQLVMIGPVKTNVDRLAAKPNVHFLGPKPYQELPAYLQAMDVLLLPYVVDDSLRSSGPVKIRECLATGKPTAARRLPDLEGLADLIHLYDEPANLIPAVRSAMAAASPELSARMRHRVRGESWDSRVEIIMKELATLNDSSRADSADQTTVTTSTDMPDWNGYLQHHPRSGVFNDARWGRLMHDVYANAAYYLTATRYGRIVGVLALVLKRSRFFGSYLCSLPYFDASGILADDDDSAAALLAEARRLVHTLGVKWAELRHVQAIGHNLPCRTDKVTLQMPLPEGADVLWKTLKASVRNQVRKAERSGMTVHHGGLEHLDEFFDVYVQNMRDLGSPPHCRRFFQTIFERFPEAATLLVVRFADRPAAAGLLLTDKQGAHVPWAASDWRLKPFCPNMLLYWSMLRFACEHGAKHFDFGRSTRDSGTYRFKKQWGAAEQSLYWQYLLAPGEDVPDLRPDSPKYRLMVACWRRLPVGLARRLGPHVLARLS